MYLFFKSIQDRKTGTSIKPIQIVQPCVRFTQSVWADTVWRRQVAILFMKPLLVDQVFPAMVNHCKSDSSRNRYQLRQQVICTSRTICQTSMLQNMQKNTQQCNFV